jgi:hypothetical protein
VQLRHSKPRDWTDHLSTVKLVGVLQLGCSEEAISITYSECVCVSVALGNQHAILMHNIILSSVACPALQYFYTLSQILDDFRKALLNVRVKCVLIFSTSVV